MRTCRYCASPLPVGSRKDKAYCSKACTDRAQPPCSLDGCDKPRRAKGLCSAHYNQAYQPNRHVKVPVACTYCGDVTLKEQDKRRRPFCDYTCRDLHRLEHPSPQAHRGRRAMCNQPSWPSWMGATCTLAEMVCNGCGATFYGKGRAGKPTCSNACRLIVKQRRHVYRRSVRREAVFERDDFMCWICGVRCDPLALVPQDEAPTVDHLIPVSLGGDNHPDNLGTAHFICNSRRGNAMVISPAA